MLSSPHVRGAITPGSTPTKQVGAGLAIRAVPSPHRTIASVAKSDAHSMDVASIQQVGQVDSSKSIEQAGPRHGLSSTSSSSKSTRTPLWAGSKHVVTLSDEDVEQMYLNLCDRSNEQHTVLVVYAPWCQHCRAMENEIELLAKGLSYDSQARVVCMNGDPPAARHLAKDVLGAQFFPSIMVFPRHSRTYYKYTGRSRDVQSLLRFMNMVCKQQEDDIWQLRQPSASPAAIVTIDAPATATAQPSQELPSSGPLGALASLPRGPITVVGGLLGLAAVAAFTKGLLSKPAAAAPAGSSSAGADVASEIDASLAQMFGVMLRLLKARLQLLLGGGQQQQPAPSNLAAAAAASSSSTTPAASQTPAAPMPSSSAAPQAAVPSSTAPAASAPPSRPPAPPLPPSPGASGGATPRNPNIVMAASASAVLSPPAQPATSRVAVADPWQQVQVHNGTWESGSSSTGSTTIAEVSAPAAPSAALPAGSSNLPSELAATASHSQHEVVGASQSAASSSSHLAPPNAAAPASSAGAPILLVAQAPAAASAPAAAGPEAATQPPTAPVLVDVATAVSGSLPGQTLEAALTQEQVKLEGKLNASMLLSMLQQDGADVNSVVEELLRVQQQQGAFRVEKLGQ